MPPRNRPSNCPCGGLEDNHIFYCWLVHVIFAMAVVVIWILAITWFFSNPQGLLCQDSICSVCACTTHKLLCADRGFSRIPDVGQDMLDRITILGFQRNSLTSIDGRFIAKFPGLILLDIRDQSSGSCVRIVGSPLPENLIVRGKLCIDSFMNLVCCELID